MNSKSHLRARFKDCDNDAYDKKADRQEECQHASRYGVLDVSRAAKSTQQIAGDAQEQ
jgi:hypothetical protein